MYYLDDFRFKDPSYYFRLIENGICPKSINVSNEILITIGELYSIRNFKKLPFAGGLMEQPNYFYMIYQAFESELNYWEMVETEKRKSNAN